MHAGTHVVLASLKILLVGLLSSSSTGQGSTITSQLLVELFRKLTDSRAVRDPVT
jgi:hypothetical protein